MTEELLRDAIPDADTKSIASMSRNLTREVRRELGTARTRKPLHLVLGRGVSISISLVGLVALCLLALVTIAVPNFKLSNVAWISIVVPIGTVVIASAASWVMLVAQGRREASQERVLQAAEISSLESSTMREDSVFSRYSQIIQHIGSEKPKVRVSGLYALEGLAEVNPEYRQLVANILCGFLRLSSYSGGEPTGDSVKVTEYRDLQERIIIQNILTSHLRISTPKFWSDIEIDLSGTVLYNVDFSSSEMTRASFHGSTFVGSASFSSSRFLESADFANVKFTGPTSFRLARFEDAAEFMYAHFSDVAYFDSAGFASAATFGNATFSRASHFEGSEFVGLADFDRAVFIGDSSFMGALFGFRADFYQSRFESVADFSEVESTRAAHFDRAEFKTPGGVRFPKGWIVDINSSPQE
ncbi:pentapeptide repeat-containing protein [Amycolatopsis circi]|uniref:pentapeptide repeat-containing protein n=1 Tax=Amycolatopsis circi TaxID=871959 RepID=UPI0013BE9AEA|nr:pentapeptide repeat-containing protein [Amycolatopsis circi]